MAGRGVIINRIALISRLMKDGIRNYTAARTPQPENASPIASAMPLQTVDQIQAASDRLISAHQTEVNGATIHFDKAGNGNHLVLLLPGALGSSKTDFANQVDFLNKDIFTIIAWDPRGYGRSRPPIRDWPQHFLKRDAMDAAKLMENVGATKYSVLGWSDGGITALLLASIYPDRIRRMVVWGANAYVTHQECEGYRAMRDVSSWSERMRRPFEEVYGEEGFQELWAQWVDNFSLYGKNPDGDICKGDLANITCPTLIIHGQKDALVPQFHAEFLNTNINKSKLTLMPDGKHNLHMKYRKEFNRLVETFLSDPEDVVLSS